jgi:Icc-related predicted phosphoesterase
MRIVAMADTHLFHRRLEVPDGDVLIHAGDLCRRGTVPELAEAVDWLRALPHRHKIIVAGNHDWPFALEPDRARALLGPDIVYLQDSGTSIAGVSFWGSPWQPAFCDWAFNLPRGAPLAARWALIPESVDVLITHGPPHGIGDATSPNEHCGCSDLLARVRRVQPRLHLFGHIHENRGIWREEATTFANVTTDECAQPPTVIDLEQF